MSTANIHTKVCLWSHRAPNATMMCTPKRYQHRTVCIIITRHTKTPTCRHTFSVASCTKLDTEHTKWYQNCAVASSQGTRHRQASTHLQNKKRAPKPKQNRTVSSSRGAQHHQASTHLLGSLLVLVTLARQTYADPGGHVAHALREEELVEL